MPDPEQKPVISDAEVEAFGLAVQMNPSGWRGAYKQALSAFLSARVPSAMLGEEANGGNTMKSVGFNACRDAVMKGLSEGEK